MLGRLLLGLILLVMGQVLDVGIGVRRLKQQATGAASWTDEEDSD